MFYGSIYVKINQKIDVKGNPCLIPQFIDLKSDNSLSILIDVLLL